MFKPMKPETIERRWLEHVAARKASRASLISRLQKLDQEQPNFIWKEMLEERLGEK